MARRGFWFKRVATTLLGMLVVLLCAVAAALLYLRIPQNAAGMAAKGVCSAAFVAGRPWQTLMVEDVLPASPVLHAISISVDEKNHSVTARFAGAFARSAVLRKDRGCVLDLPPDATAQATQPQEHVKLSWPVGDAALPPETWGPGVDAKRLTQVVDAAFAGAGDPQAGNARGLAVLYQGRALVLREAPGFTGNTPLHGWSMSKTVTGMLAHKRMAETGLSLDTAVVDAFAAQREPAWVSAWRRDARKNIKVADLLYMRDGLATTENYQPWGAVPQMLWGAPDVAAWAAAHPVDAPAGERWRYLSATANLLAAVLRGQFASDADYWAYPAKTLFEPIGARTAVMETDTAGNWVGSSYLWASLGDWARLGQLMLQDGQWAGRQVMPAGWLARASTASTLHGAGRGYGAQSWLIGQPEAGICKAVPGVPPDTVAMIGHWGQLVAMVPSRQVVVVRLGWTFKRKQFDNCKLLADVLSALPK